MRKNLVIGVFLALAAGLIVIISSALDLELESAALLGGALGAVIALIPDRSIVVRLGGFAAGLVFAWLGYAVRAAFLPDSSSGRAVAVILTVLLCVVVAAATDDRIPLWPLLLGTAAFAGAYEFTYNEAPPELLTTSVSTMTTLLFNVAVGFLAVTLVRRPGPTDHEQPRRRETAPTDDRTDAKMDDFMGAEAK
jgi:hypothetical protein